MKLSVEEYHNNIITKLRGTPTTTGLINPNVADISNGDIVIFNNQSTSVVYEINVTSALRSGKDVWDSTEKTFIDKDMDGNITITLPAESFSNIYFSDIGYLTFENV